MVLEWLPFSLPNQLRAQSPGLFGSDTVELVLSRKDDLGLRTEVTTRAVLKDEVQGVPGSESIGATLEVVTQHQRPATLRGYRTLNHQMSTVSGERLTRIIGSADSLEIEFNPGTSEAVTEWLAHMPQRLWPQGTERSSQTRVSRRRGTILLEDDLPGERWAGDYAEIALGLPTLAFLHVGAVDSSHVTEGATISNPGFIEFHRGESGLPSSELRHSVRRAFEFLFGCGLGVLGWSESAADGVPIRATLSRPVVAGSGPPLPPALLHDQLVDGIDEKFVATFVRRYLELESTYDLNRTVWLFLHARDAPLDMCSGYLGAAFEILRRGYYKQPTNESRSRVFSKSEWKTLSTELNLVAETIGQRDGWPDLATKLSALKQKLGGLNEVSGTRLNRQILDDLHLRHGETEKEALQSRNDAAHGNALTADEYFRTLRLYRALHTLYARVLFAIIGVEVTYIDYSTLGFPPRALCEVQGTPAPGRESAG